MANFKANKETYFFNSKASVVFLEEVYTPKNKAEEELLEEKAKGGFCIKLQEEKKVEEKPLSKKEKKLD